MELQRYGDEIAVLNYAIITDQIYLQNTCMKTYMSHHIRKHALCESWPGQNETVMHIQGMQICSLC